MNSAYSLSLDTSTLAGQNLLVVKARYIKTEMKENEPTLSLENMQDKVVSVAALNESSDAKTLHGILHEKVFSKSDLIQNNMKGFTHDKKMD